MLLGVYSMNTTTALSEISIANSKVDFVIVNDKAVAYEIKMDLYNLDRLRQQLLDYYKIFRYVYVVTTSNHVRGVQQLINELKIPVGILVLTKRITFKKITCAKEYTGLLCKEEMFRALRKKEYEHIIKNIMVNCH